MTDDPKAACWSCGTTGDCACHDSTFAMKREEAVQSATAAINAVRKVDGGMQRRLTLTFDFLVKQHPVFLAATLASTLVEIAERSDEARAWLT